MAAWVGTKTRIIGGIKLQAREKALIIIGLLEKAYPQAGTKLQYSSNFELLVAIVLSAQTNDDQVNKVTRDLFYQYKQPHEFAALSEAKLQEKIKSVGLYKNKARHIIQMARMICHKYQGVVPSTLEELLELPGVGRKSANVMLSVGFNQPGLGVDTHVQRVSNRIGIVSGQYPDQTEIALKKLVPESMWTLLHHLLIHHGRAVCKAKNPQCAQCVIASYCEKKLTNAAGQQS